MVKGQEEEFCWKAGSAACEETFFFVISCITKYKLLGFTDGWEEFNQPSYFLFFHEVGFLHICQFS